MQQHDRIGKAETSVGAEPAPTRNLSTRQGEEDREADLWTRRLVEILSAPVVYLDQQERFRFVNRAFQSWFGVDPSRIVGRSLREVAGEAAYAAARPGIREVLAGHVVQWEGEVTCANGSRRPIVARYLPDADVDGHVHGFYGVLEEGSQQQRMQERLHEATTRAARIEQQERRRLAEELHADLGQRLSLLALRLRSLEEAVGPVEARLLEDLGALASDTCRRLTSFGFRVYPTLLYDVGFVAASHWLAEELATSLDMEVHIDAANELPDLDEEARTTLYRVLRELLENVASHAGTKEAWVRISSDPVCARLEVEDAGPGICAGADTADDWLLRAREDVGRLGGRVEIRNDGSAACACVELPLRKEGWGT